MHDELWNEVYSLRNFVNKVLSRLDATDELAGRIADLEARIERLGRLTGHHIPED